MYKHFSLALMFVALLLGSSACKKDQGINIFTLEQDKEFGAQLKTEIDANPAEYPLLPYAGNEAAYQYLYDMRDEILSSDELNYRSDFGWDLYIIQDDNTLNAFCAPGGYIYVYTGLIKFLDDADDLAGVLGHEIAHADQRHSTQQMTEAYGISTLLSVLAGDDPGMLAQIVTNLTSLSFSRSHERDADDHSVDYLCDTEYASNGASAFFQKLIDQGQSGSTPAFLSTHPNPDNRVQDINDRAAELGCSTTPKANAGYAAFKALLP
ncbi:M48 family metalloprotease [Saprospira sp. CCB-QB6]|uniref:M48 family metalloprotease n=1 Tax=Saprospira sp. CCB-QB6 TaxID=3023936 RepID=UPI00234AEE11|nr:M48 family metalloprotease [Saprospira sp. CCB-QB6]WCL82965.1 M48 family metalloprotease [Saprospira sp. CCB-QB6]